MNRFLLAMWQWGDHVYRRVRRFDYQDMQGGNVFRIRVRPYSGPDFSLPDGLHVQSGDWVGFLHFYNLRLQQLLQGVQSENRRGLLVLREVQRSLPELAEFVKSHPRGQRIKALIGITLLNRGVEPLGFAITDVPDTAWFRFKTWYMKLMLQLCHPDGQKRVQQKAHGLMLKRLVLTRDELFRRYSAAAGKSRQPYA